MKKGILAILFLIILVIGIYGQIRPEYRWILGTWVGTDSSQNSVEIALNNDGTGRWGGRNIIYSIEGNAIQMFHENGLSRFWDGNIWRINDQRMILRNGNYFVNLNKRN